MLSITTYRPVGVVSVVCTPQSKTVDYLKLIFGVIAYGNSVVLIHATNDELVKRVKTFCQHIDIPKGLVNFLSNECLYDSRDKFCGSSYLWLYPSGSHIVDHTVISTAFTEDITKLNTSIFRWLTEPKSVFVPTK